jgi:excisionase family DNA binding protein
MPGKRPDRRRVKIHRTYTVDEAARTLGVAKGTVRRWLKNGLPTIDHRKPALIRGLDLAEFLKSKATPKQSCPPGHCYCVKCRSAQRPDGAMADYIITTATSGNLRGLCPTCGSWMHRRTSHAQLAAVRTQLDVTIVERSPRLRDSRQPSTNDHLQ